MQNKNKMNKIGIISLFGLYNYGNRLQGYALDCALSELGFYPETIVLYRKLGLSFLAAQIRTFFRACIKSSNTKKRDNRFREFVSGQKIKYVIFPYQIRHLSKKYSYFCVGSDQVWNPNADLFKHTKLLEFAECGQKIAVAPSFGVSELPESCIDEYRLALSSYKSISVREEEGAALVESLVGKRPKVLIDPTLAISDHKWREVADYSFVPQQKYVLVYFLGGWSGNLSDYIYGIDENSYQVIDLLDNNSIYYACGPQDFIGLIDKANLVLTDSFHASVFSTLFGTPFRVFHRSEKLSTYSRIATLLKTYQVGNVEGYGAIPEISNDQRDITVGLLESKRIEFIQYLRKALDV